jgi:arylsulfatase A-like enzyme
MNLMTDSASPRSRFVAVALGAVLFVALDTLVGAAIGVGRISGAERHALYAQVVLAHAAVLGIGAGLAVALLHAIFGRFRAKIGLFRPTWTTILLALLSAAVVEHQNWELFRGPQIVNKSFRVPLEIIFRVLAPPATFLGAVGVAAAAESRGAKRRLFGLLSAGVALALLYGSATLYRRQYPELHLQMALGAFGASALAVRALFDGSFADLGKTRGRAAVVFVALLAVFGGLFLSKRSARFESVKGVALERADGVSRLARFSGKAVQFAAANVDLGPGETIDVADLMRRLSGGDDAEIQKILDETYPDRSKLNVLMLAVDTLRADHCGFLNPEIVRKYGRSPTPNLDLLAKDSFVFERAYTPYPTSSYAFNATFMSVAPRITKVYTDKYDASKKHEPTHPYPALLAEKGWKTAAVSSFNREDLANPRKFKHLKEGFEIFNPTPFESAASAPQITASSIDVFTKIGAEGRLPFFSWVHYMDPHSPYQDNAGFDFGRTTRDWYVSDIAYADHHLGELIEALKRLRLWDDTVVMVFSDHGEEFGEHGGREHNCSVYEEQIHVPLLVKLPKIDPKGKRVRSAVSLLDLVPTLNRLLKVDDSIPRLGKSLLPLMFGPESEDGGVAYAEWFDMTGNFRTQERRAVVLGRRKLIYRVNERSFELYDLEKDPLETTSLIGDAEDEASLKALLAAWDKRIDEYFGGPTESRRSPTETFDEIFERLKRLNAEAKAAAATDRKLAREKTSAATAAALEYRNALMSGYGDVLPHVSAALTDEQLDGLFTRLADLHAELEDGPAAEALVTLSRRRDPRFAAVYKREIDLLLTSENYRVRSGTIEALLALASLGDQSVKPALEALYRDDGFPFKGPIANGLIQLGDLSGAEWYLTNLASLRFGWVYRDAILALKSAPEVLRHVDFSPSRHLRDRLTEEDYRHPALEVAYVEALSALKDDESTMLLFRFARHGLENVRNAAQKELRLRVTDPAVFERRLEAAGEELAADNMLLNMAPEAATPTYRRASETAGVFNAALRFRMARAFHLAGATESARTELEAIAKDAPLEIDRALAKRRLAQLRWSLRQNPAAFKCEVVAFEPSPVVRAAQYYLVKAKLKNTGTEPWWGGFSRDSMEVGLRFMLPDGKIYEMQEDKNITNRLPEGGVEPGEEVEMALLGWGPRKKLEGAKVSIVFRNDRLPNLPKGGVVFTAPEATDFDAPPPSKNASAPK